MATFSQRLTQLRKDRDMTQEQLSNALNITRSRLAMYEQGKREPDFELQEAIADYFNIDMDYLHGRDTVSSYSANLKELSSRVTIDITELNEEHRKRLMTYYLKLLELQKMDEA